MKENLTERNERRQYKRHLVNEGAQAIINLDFQIQGQIINISKEGLSFCYVNKKDLELLDIETDVYLDNNGTFIAKIPCKVVWDKKISYSATKGQDLIRECGLEFTKCSENQLAQLNNFFSKKIINVSESNQ